MKSYFRVMLGKQSIHAPACFEGNFIGADFGVTEDLKDKLPEDGREFNRSYVPRYLEVYPDKSRIGAGLACGFLWTVCKGIQKTDVVLCPDGEGNYRVGEVAGDYYHVESDILPHRRPVQWFSQLISRADMSEALRRSSGSIGTVSDVSGHRAELEKLLGGIALPTIITTDPTVEDLAAFAMEKHLEDFLVQNWAQSELGREYDIFEEDGEPVGQQYQTDTGPMDVLAISKNKKKLLVVELKKGRASDAVVGQVLRYMGYVKDELAEDGQTVHGVIIAQDEDQRIRRALSAAPDITFYRYQISFKLVKS